MDKVDKSAICGCNGFTPEGIPYPPKSDCTICHGTGERWCAVEGCDEPPVWTDPDGDERACPKHVNYGCEGTPYTATCPSGQTIDLALWLRVRASLLPALEKSIGYPLLTDGLLKDATDAACDGFIAHALNPGFRQPFAEWYASQVVGAMRL